MAIALEKLNKIDGDIFNGSDVGKIDSNNMIVQNKVNDLEDTTNNLQTKINNINSELDLKPSANDVVSLTSFQNHQNATNPHNTTYVSLKDVVLTNPTSDQVLGYDPLTSKIINKSNVGTISASADKLATSRKIGTSGDVTGTPTNFDGSADITIPMTLTNTGVTAGTYSKVTVDSKGRVTGGNSLTATDIPSLTLAKISDAGTSASKNVGVNPNDVVGVGSNGKIDTNLIPSIAITETFPVTSTAQMTLLTHAEIGDVAVVNPDGSHATSYILSANDPTVLTNWILLNTPSDVTTITGNAGSASKLQTARNINITGGATGTGSFDGSSDVNINVSLNDTYTKNEVDNLVNGKVSQATGYLAVFVLLAGADGEHFALVGLLGGGVGDDDARGGLTLFLEALDDHAIMQRTQFHRLHSSVGLLLRGFLRPERRAPAGSLAGLALTRSE
jgi:phage-related tail fiber protein